MNRPIIKTQDRLQIVKGGEQIDVCWSTLYADTVKVYTIDGNTLYDGNSGSGVVPIHVYHDTIIKIQVNNIFWTIDGTLVTAIVLNNFNFYDSIPNVLKINYRGKRVKKTKKIAKEKLYLYYSALFTFLIPLVISFSNIMHCINLFRSIIEVVICTFIIAHIIICMARNTKTRKKRKPYVILLWGALLYNLIFTFNVFNYTYSISVVNPLQIFVVTLFFIIQLITFLKLKS